METTKKEQARAAKKSRLLELKQKAKQLAGAQTVEEYGKAQAAADPLNFYTLNGHHLSGTNCVYLLMQGYTGGVVGTFRQWREHGKQVKKGEHGLYIRRPIIQKPKKGEPEATEDDPKFFMFYSVFMESQTAEIPEDETAEDAEKRKTKNAEADFRDQLRSDWDEPTPPAETAED